MSSPTDRDHFTEHGWLVLRGAVAPERVAQLEGALDALVPPASYPAWGGRVVEVASLSRISAVLRSHAHEARFAGRVAQLLGTPRVQLLQDTALIKPAASPATVAWHQDYRYFTYLDRPQVVTARLALTRCSEGSGCLRVLDGSHAWGLLGDDLNFRHGSVEDGLQGLGLPHR